MPIRLLSLILAAVACGSVSDPPQQNPPSTQISGRWLHAMVYDAARSRVLVFGGRTKSGANDVFLNDLWAWDGSTWSHITTSVAPPARGDMLLTYDAARQRVVLYGGADESGLLTDTWEWDGTAWTQKATSGPPARKHFGGGYDAARGRTVVYGGLTLADVALTDTWEWDGTSWTQRASTRPSPLDAPTQAVFDTGRNALLMVVGAFSTGPSETWQWNGANWSVVGPGPAIAMPNATTGAGAASYLYSAGSAGVATWRWNGTAWSSLATPTTPALRFGAAMAYDAARSRVVLFGGLANNAYSRETWTFDGTSWSLVP